jgi:predicted 2-oxoglutarate/Fe(II)-dependent dioxygenase YbiX
MFILGFPPRRSILMTLRDNVLIQPKALNTAMLKLLMEHVHKAQQHDSLVAHFADDEEAGAVEWVVNKKIRDTQEVSVPSSILETVIGSHNENVTTLINPFYQIQVRDTEPLLMLHYGVGGHYIPHVDAETLYKDEDELCVWEKTLDRDLSVVYFLNEDFAGGELVFPELDLLIKPEAGTLICFPSDHNYIHGVNPVTSGHRYAIVTWMRVQGMPSLEEINQMSMDQYHRLWPQQIEQPPRLNKQR